MTAQITVYSTNWCGYCTRLKSQLVRAGIEFNEVNIEKDRKAAKFVENANNGCRTVPTVRFPDDSTLTNPSVMQIQQRLDRLNEGR